MVLALALTLMMPAASVLAYDPIEGPCSASSDASSVCHEKSVDPNETLRKVSSLIAWIAGVAAVIIIIISGFMYVTSGGDPQKTASARSALIGAIVGLVVIVAAESILLFVLGKVG